MPFRVRRILQGGFASSSANSLLRNWGRPEGRGRPSFVHPGDLFGIVLAWLWQDDRGEAMVFLADYLAELNVHNDQAGVHGAVTREQLLRGLELSMPRGFDDLAALSAMARDEVPGYDGGAV